jgi:glycosyltransferase involved in cell wall biosynthesis
MSAVSVIIPTFNRAQWVGEAIQSVLEQHTAEFEVIVVDDGSSDDTADVLKLFSDKIRVLTQTNRGVSAARNAGIAAAGGDLIAFLDSDDLWLAGKLSAQIEFFRTHPGALICQTDEIWVRNGVRVNPRQRHRKPQGDFFERSLQLCLVSPSAVMMRRTLFDVVGFFDENLPACEDYDLWLRVACRYPVYLIDQPLIIKRGGHADQLSNAPGLDRFRIDALHRLLTSNLLNRRQSELARTTLLDKSAIYLNGCRKRGKQAQVDHYQRLADRWRQAPTSYAAGTQPPSKF